MYEYTQHTHRSICNNDLLADLRSHQLKGLMPKLSDRLQGNNTRREHGLLGKKVLDGSNKVSAETDQSGDVHVTLSESHVVESLQHLFEAVGGRGLNRLNGRGRWDGSGSANWFLNLRDLRSRSRGNMDGFSSGSRDGGRDGGGLGLLLCLNRLRRRGGRRVRLLGANLEEVVVRVVLLVEASLAQVEVGALQALEALSNNGMGIASIANHMTMNVLAFLILDDVVLEALPPGATARAANLRSLSSFAALMPPRATTPLATSTLLVLILMLLGRSTWRAANTNHLGLDDDPKTKNILRGIGQTNSLNQFFVGGDLKCKGRSHGKIRCRMRMGQNRWKKQSRW